MHLPTTCGIFGLLMAVLLHVAVTFPVDESALAQRESYLAADEVFGPELKERGEREKRKGGFLEPVVEASFGVKSRVIGLIFGASYTENSLEPKTGYLKVEKLRELREKHCCNIGEWATFYKINQLIDSKNRWVDQLDRKNIELNRRIIANQNCNTGTGGTSSGSTSSGSTTNGGSSGSTSGPVYNAPAAPQSGSTSFAGQSRPTFTSSPGQSAINYNPSVGQTAINYNPTAGQAAIGYNPTGGQTVASFGTSFGTSAGQSGPSLEYLPPQTGPSYDTSGASYQQNVPSTGNGYGYTY